MWFFDADAVDDHQGQSTGIDWCGVSRDPSAEFPTIVLRERVRLSDTDSSGLIFWGAVPLWLTRAQAELWLALGFRQEGLGPSPMMPVVNANLSYHASLRLGDAYELRCWIDEAGRTSLTVGFEVVLAGQICVSARMTHVHLDPTTNRPASLPDAMVGAARVTR